jgi:hypothetical protein
MTMVPPTIPHGLYRWTDPTNRALAFVNFGDHTAFMSRDDYWCALYEPVFEKLPTKEEYAGPRAFLVDRHGRAQEKLDPPSPSKMNRTELARHLEKVRERVVEAKASVKRHERLIEWLEKIHDDDFYLASANHDCFERRVKLRIAELNQFEEFLRNAKLKYWLGVLWG